MTPTSTHTHTFTPGPPSLIVLSEFRTRGPNGDEDELVELYNPTANSVNLGGWQVWKSSGCGLVTSLLFTVPANTWLPPGRHFLAASDNSSISVSPDLVYSGQLFDNGGLALLDSASQIVDQVGMCATTQYREGTSLPPLSGDLNQSYERKPGGGSGSCYDTNDNFADFSSLSPSDPQNLASAPVYCSGVSTSTPTFTPTFTSTPTPTSTSTATRTPTITNTPVFTTHLVISEFRTRGPNGADDEFVELYNPTGGAVNIGGWTVRRSSSCGSTISTLVTITNGVILQPGQHYLLLSNTNSSLSGADQTFSPGIADEGGVALLNASSAIVDQAGMCSTTTYREGTSLTPLSGTSNQSYERKAGGSTSCFDTDNNSSDFQLISPSNPQNQSSPAALCTGVVTYTPTRTPTRTLTRTYTPFPTAYPGNVVLNEYLPRPASDWDGDGEANSRDEYIELINMGTVNVNIKNWKLDDFAEGGSSPYTLPDLTLAPYQIVHFYASETGISLSDGGDTVRLIKPDGKTADLQNYSIVTASDRTWCRLPDGNGAWTFECRPTPGRPNARAGSASPEPGEEQPEVRADCLLPDTVPQAFWVAECGSFGGNIWERKTDQEFWLENRWKWGIFVE